MVLGTADVSEPEGFSETLREWMDPQGTDMMGRRMLGKLGRLSSCWTLCCLFCLRNQQTWSSSCGQTLLWARASLWGSSARQGTSGLDSSDVTLHRGRHWVEPGVLPSIPQCEGPSEDGRSQTPRGPC